MYHGREGCYLVLHTAGSRPARQGQVHSHGWAQRSLLLTLLMFEERATKSAANVLCLHLNGFGDRFQPVAPRLGPRGAALLPQQLHMAAETADEGAHVLLLAGCCCVHMREAGEVCCAVESAMLRNAQAGCCRDCIGMAKTLENASSAGRCAVTS